MPSIIGVIATTNGCEAWFDSIAEGVGGMRLIDKTFDATGLRAFSFRSHKKERRIAMLTIDRVAELISYSPGWARVALTAPNERLRNAAAETLAAIIVEHHDDPPLPCRDHNQLALPL